MLYKVSKMDRSDGKFAEMSEPIPSSAFIDARPEEGNSSVRGKIKKEKKKREEEEEGKEDGTEAWRVVEAQRKIDAYLWDTFSKQVIFAGGRGYYI